MHSKHAVRKTGAIITTITFIMLCPLITYAAASGMEILQNNVVIKYHGERSVKLSPSVKFDSQIITDHSGSGSNQVSYISHLDPRGINNIDTTISSDEELQIGPVSLDSNSSIRVVISSGHESDSFRVGIIDPDKTRHYINSERGAAVKTFKISSKGLYTVYIQGRNGKNGNSIYLTGTIFINN